MKYIMCIFLFACLVSCSSQNNNSESGKASAAGPAELEPDSLFQSMLKIHTDMVRCADCLNEIYIDVVEPHKTIFTFKNRPFPSNYFSLNHPLQYIRYKDITFYIYSGIEKYFTYIPDTTHIATAGTCTPDTWVYLDSFGVLKAIHAYATPFMPLPQNKHEVKEVAEEHL